MNIWDFILGNFISILLALGLLVTIFVTKSTKEKRSIIIISLLVLVVVRIILGFFYKDSLSEALNVLIHLLTSITVYFFSLLFCPLKKEYHLSLLAPLIIGGIFTLIFKESYVLIAYITVGVYLLLMLAYSIFLFIKKEKNEGTVLLASTLINIGAVFIDYFNASSGIISSTILLGTLLIFLKEFIKGQNEKTVIQEKLIQGQKTSIAISQIQPHFLYNSLATIGYLCKKDPEMASKAIDQFSDYLRANLNSLSQMTNVPFNNELKHVQTYLWLEKLRFEDRLEVEYDIQVSNFLIPSLSIQPLVENAVKHGICEKIEGGKITIRTIEYAECIKIMIEDNGVGFDTKKKPKDGRVHVGISNVKSRIQSMADGTLEIRSEIGKGTISTITIPRR